MISPCRDVEPSRLRLLLADDLSESEKRPLEFHLESCADCRAALEELAGAPGWWDEVRRLVPRELAPPPSGHPTADHRRDDPDPPGHPGEAEASRPPGHAPGDLWLDFLAPSENPEALGRLDCYEVLDVLGRGGMGVVLKALDPALDRMVALKVLSPALAASGAARHRFAREARAAAAVVHEHVVAIHAVSSWRGLPYLVMQYVSGRSLQERIDQDGPLAVEEILRIGMQAAAGLAAAHAHGLVHRDVKPSNILLENGVERVKLTDFGLARAADDASLTQSGILAGTPQYMAPEQAQGEAVDHRADLFSLGSVLYAMCAGRPPFRAETTMAVIRRVCDERARPLRDINPEIPAWLAAIIARLHAKHPAKRFQTATEVAELLGTHLARLRQGESGPARPSPVAQKVRGFSWPIAAGMLVVLAGLGVAEAGGRGVVSALVGTVLRIITAEGTLSIQVDDPEVKVRVDGEEVVITGTGPQEFRYRPGTYRVLATRDGVPLVEKVVTIHRGGKEIVSISREGTIAAGQHAAEDPLRDRSLRNRPRSARPGGPPPPAAPQPAPAAMEAQPLQERIRKLEEQLAHLQAGRAAAATPGIAPTPTTAPPLAIAPPPAAVPGPGRAPARGQPGAPIAPGPPGGITAQPGISPTAPAPAQMEIAPPGQAIPAPGGAPAQGQPGAPIGLEPVRGTVLLPGGARGTVAVPGIFVTTPAPVVAGSDASSAAARLPAASTRAAVQTPENVAPGPEPDYPAGASAPRAKVPSPPQPEAAPAPVDGGIAAGPAVASAALGPVPEAARPATATPAGPTPLSGARAVSTDVDIHRILTPLPLTDASPASLWSHGVIYSAAFAPEDRDLALACRDGTVVVCSLRPRGIRTLLQAHSAVVWSVAIAPDGETLASAAGDWLDNGGSGEIKMSNLATKSSPAIIHADGPAVFSVAFAPNGKTLASGGRDQMVRLWDVRSGRLIRELRGHRELVRSVAFHPDGRTVVSAGFDATIRFWDVASGGETRPAILLAGAPANCVVISRDGRTLAAPTSAQDLQPATPRADGEGLTAPGEIRLWDWESGKVARILRGCRYGILGLALSPDGRLLASGGGLHGTAGEVKLWDTSTGRWIADLKGHRAWVECVAFSPDGKTLVSAGGWGDGPGEIKLWDLRARPERESDPLR